MPDRPSYSVHLPPAMCREIGRIIVRWGYLENYIQHTVWMVIGVSPEEGRLAVTEGRLNERLDRIVDLSHLYGLKLDLALIKTMTKGITQVVELRDAIAHGAWAFLDEHDMWGLTVTKGSWPDQTMPKTERKKKVTPEGLLTNMEALRWTIGRIDELIAQAKTLHEMLAVQIEAWHEKPPQASDRSKRNQARSPS